ncbi:MAG: nicotinate-nucleotide adenylyltransferase, partial [Muribaculaceae bacterium]|nr:nicotinate-nucleotide adenylyltransferase [Muribaculaceae bacterium]
VCDVELSLPRPSYTINTLRHLTSERPDCRFRLIVGADNYAVFDRWREHDRLIADYGLIVYPRQGFDAEAGEKGVTIVEAPLYVVSSTEIRVAIADGDDFSTMVPSSVADYIKENKLYGYGRE